MIKLICEKSKKLAGKIAVYTVIYVVLLTAYAFLLYKYVDNCKYVQNQYDVIKNGEIVEAELVRYEWTGESAGQACYHVIYEYVDGDIKYQGVGLYNLKYYDAEESLGKKIEIYIDGKGLSLPVGYSPDIVPLVIFSIIMAVVFFVVFFWPYVIKKISQLWENADN